MNASDELFLTTKQPVLKLSIAVSRYFADIPLTEELEKTLCCLFTPASVSRTGMDTEAKKFLIWYGS